MSLGKISILLLRLKKTKALFFTVKCGHCEAPELLYGTSHAIQFQFLTQVHRIGYGEVQESEWMSTADAAGSIK